MAVLSKFEQSPNERLRYSIDYSNWLATDELLSSANFTVTPTTSPAFVVDGSAIVEDSKKLVFYMSGGVDLTDYKLEVFASTSESQIREDVITFKVRDP